jgi:hypothetical protein
MAKERSAKPVCRHCGVQSVGTDDETLAETSAKGATSVQVKQGG